MAMRIDGPTPPCVPSAEVCDGIDHDCDGLIDAADPDLTGTGDACQCDDVTLTCDNGPRAGQCQTGVTACTAGAITCHGTGTPSAEICDGSDNNGNGQLDDNPSGTGAACEGQDSDLCKEGQIVCLNGALTCNDNTGPNVEIDDGVTQVCYDGDPGTSGIGVCHPGLATCAAGFFGACANEVTPQAEVCNGLDDDCNGAVDDAPGGGAIVATCYTGPAVTENVGTCQSGTQTCAFGAFDAGAGAAIVPQIVASLVASKPAALAAWTDFRANQIDGGIYVPLSH